MNDYKAIIIGGSAGSFQLVTRLIASLPANYPLPIIMCHHRLKPRAFRFRRSMSIKSKMPIIEPHDKEPIKSGPYLLAPANYHLYIELGNRFSLSTEDVVNHSRLQLIYRFFRPHIITNENWLVSY
jgi:two-component system chemotaxis response regulator CheB